MVAATRVLERDRVRRQPGRGLHAAGPGRRNALAPNPHLQDVQLLEGVFSDAECDRIVALGQSRPRWDGRCTSDDPTYRVCLTSWLEQQGDNAWVFERMPQAVHEANRRASAFDLAGFGEPLHYVEYGAGGGFEWHSDLTSGRASNRKLSVSVQLSSPEDYEGGELELCPHGVMKGFRERGSVLVFPAFIPHRVLRDRLGHAACAGRLDPWSGLPVKLAAIGRGKAPPGRVGLSPRLLTSLRNTGPKAEPRNRNHERTQPALLLPSALSPWAALRAAPTGTTSRRFATARCCSAATSPRTRRNAYGDEHDLALHAMTFLLRRNGQPAATTRTMLSATNRRWPVPAAAVFQREIEEALGRRCDLHRDGAHRRRARRRRTIRAPRSSTSSRRAVVHGLLENADWVVTAVRENQIGFYGRMFNMQILSGPETAAGARACRAC